MNTTPNHFADKIPPILTVEIADVEICISSHYKKASNKLAEQHLLALGRRYSMMSDAYLEIAQLFCREPNSEHELNYFNIYLNSLYINIFGSLENLSWLIYFEKIYPKTKLGKKQISLFGEKFITTCMNNGIEINSLKEEYCTWINELKKKRDPIAHQVPLYIPYRVIRTDEQIKQYKDLENRANDKLRENDTQGYTEILFAARKVGDFIPMIWLVDSVEETLNFVDFKDIINPDMIKLNKIVEKILNTIY